MRSPPVGAWVDRGKLFYLISPAIDLGGRQTDVGFYSQLGGLCDQSVSLVMIAFRKQ